MFVERVGRIMPTYVYRCANCGSEQSLAQGFDAPNTTKCPVCGSIMARVIFAPTLHMPHKIGYEDIPADTPTGDAPY
jgi:putative FmdB family regulatory protein